MRVEVHATSDVGLQRSHNEDIALIGNRLLRDDRYDGIHEVSGQGRPYMLAVADGLGGQNAGEVASREVLTAFRDEVCGVESGLSGPAVTHRLTGIGRRIQDDLLARGDANPRHSGMSTTLTAVVVYEGQFYLAHAGDSRCYVMHNGVFRRVTRDHTLREFTGNPNIPGNILVNCFGTREEFFVDASQFGTEGDQGDLFLICSDGLSDMVPDNTLEETIGGHDGLDVMGGRLLELACAAGGRDNITFILARIL